MDRKQYWNESYLKYWEAKVNEANNDEELTINKNDVKTISDNLVFEYCDLVNLNKNMNVLDFGCGFGRCYSYFKNKKVSYHGIDISEAMINESKRLYPELNNKLIVNEGEKLDFNSLYFDFILCFGVFDACYQEDALKEILRVLKKDGVLLLTGKNNLYIENDEKAFVAEKNARAKGHPNYFTNVKSVINQLSKYGYSVEDSFYFFRRGDFQEKKYVKQIPDRFYEYLLIIKKDGIEIPNFNKFSDSYSDTFRETKI
jgi:ubiquinone/menaquinone biosynthesis C-methylase UbiE